MLKKHYSTLSDVHVDSVRGVAAIIVAFGHARGLFFSSLSNPTPVAGVLDPAYAAPTVEQLTIGHQAVIVFFVLSGYLVGGGVLKSFAADRWLWSEYLVKRLVRLWIVLVPALLIGVLIDNVGFHVLAQTGSIYAAPHGQEYVRPDCFTRGLDFRTIIGNLLFLQGIFVPVAGTNIALWSLSNEFWYYLMFPMFLLVFQRNTTVARRVAFGLAAFGIAALIGVNATYLFLVWVLGAIVSSMPPRIPSRIAGLVVLVGGLGFGVVFLTLKKFGLPLSASEILIGVLTALLIYAIRCQNSAYNVSIYSQTSQFFAKISYTIYLTHLPFLIFISAVVNAPWKHWVLSPVTLAEFVTVLSLAIVWAWALYLLFESKTDAVRQIVWSKITKLAGNRAAGAMVRGQNVQN